METTIFRNEEKISTEEVLKRFVETLERSYNVEQSEIDMLTEIAAKNPVDKFIISEMPDEAARQGDILIWSEKSPEYKANISRVRNLQKTDRLVLQEGDSLTGDHEIVPVSTAKYTMQTGEFIPEIVAGVARGDTWNCKLLEIDSPFILKHREHGNMTFLKAGKYMFCSQMDAESLERMKD